MDFVWTPWRYRYIANAAKEERERCVFCDALAAGDDARVHIVLRTEKNFVILNKYPYTSGHVMVVPYAHGGDFAAFDPDTLTEMMLLAKRIQAAQESIYHPDGYNLGMNVGRSAGAGITNHLHLHLLPRWTGDTNFMTTIAETRLEPEELDETYRKLRHALGLNGNGISDPTVSLGGRRGSGQQVNFALSDDQTLLRQSVREFAEREVRPLAHQIDETGEFPLKTFHQAAALGLTAIALPEAYGGAGFDHASYAIVIEEIARVCASTAVILSVQNSLYCDPIHRFGTEEQKQKFLIPFARGERIGCFALTEPQAGSYAAGLTTIGVRRGDRYVLNGTKAWITNGGVADAVLVYVNTDPSQGEKGITALIVERGTPGFKVGKEEKKLGIHATACTELVFADCEVPVANRLGAEGQGYKIALTALDGGRVGIAAQATGIAQGAFEQAVAYAKQRQAFGHPIANFQAIQFMLADMATEIDAARLLVRKAAWKQDSGARFSLEASIAKLFASEMATRVTHKAMQIHGANGYSREYPVERMYRDARVTEIYEGTSEIQRMIIGSSMVRTS